MAQKLDNFEIALSDQAICAISALARSGSEMTGADSIWHCAGPPSRQLPLVAPAWPGDACPVVSGDLQQQLRPAKPDPPNFANHCGSSPIKSPACGGQRLAEFSPV